MLGVLMKLAVCTHLMLEVALFTSELQASGRTLWQRGGDGSRAKGICRALLHRTAAALLADLTRSSTCHHRVCQMQTLTARV